MPPKDQSMQVDPDDGEGHSIILIAFETEGAAALLYITVRQVMIIMGDG